MRLSLNKYNINDLGLYPFFKGRQTKDGVDTLAGLFQRAKIS